MGLLYHNVYMLIMKYVCLLPNCLLKIIAPMHLTKSQNRKKKQPTGTIACSVSAVPQRFFYHVPEHDNSIAYNACIVETGRDSCDVEDS